MTVHDPHQCIYYIYEYSDPVTRKTVRLAKAFDKPSMHRIASDTVIWIRNFMRERQAYLLLLLHAPSSAFASGKKPKDHLACTLDSIIDAQRSSPLKEQAHFDAHPHFFLIDRLKRASQHTLSREDRIEASENRFEILHPISSPRLSRKSIFNNIMRICLYDAVFILDDVATTGSTLSELADLLERRLLRAIATHESMSKNKRGSARINKQVGHFAGSPLFRIPPIYALAYAH